MYIYIYVYVYIYIYICKNGYNNCRMMYIFTHMFNGRRNGNTNKKHQKQCAVRLVYIQHH